MAADYPRRYSGKDMTTLVTREGDIGVDGVKSPLAGTDYTVIDRMTASSN